MLRPNEVARIAHRVAKGYGALAVGSFGSYALGRSREGSDLDLFVIKQTIEPPALRRRRVKQILADVIYRLDIHVFTPDEFAESEDEEFSFVWVIARQAKIYFWSDEADRRLPFSRLRASAVHRPSAATPGAWPPAL